MQLLRWLSEVVLSRYFSRRDGLVEALFEVGAHLVQPAAERSSRGTFAVIRNVRTRLTEIGPLEPLQKSEERFALQPPTQPSLLLLQLSGRPLQSAASTQSGAAHECTRKLHFAHRCRCTIGDLDVRGVHRCPARALGPARRTPRFGLTQMFFKRNIERVWHPTVESLVQIA
jgi:hypothetical protein